MSDSLTVEQLYVLKRQIDDLKAINTYIKANRDGKLPKKKRPTTTPTISFRANPVGSTKKRGRPSLASKRNLIRIVTDDRNSSEEHDKVDDDGDNGDEEEEASSDSEDDAADEEQEIVLPSGSGSDGSDFKLDKQHQKELFNENLPQRTLPARKRTVKSFREVLTTDDDDEEDDDDDQGFEEEEGHNSDSDGGQSDSDGNQNVGIEASLDEEDAAAAAILLTTVNVATTIAGGVEGGGGGDDQVEPALEGV